MYYSMKHVVPEFFTNRDPCEPGVTSVHNFIQFVMLPKLGPGNYRTSILRVTEADFSKVSACDIAKYITMVGDIRMVEGRSFGENIVLDLAMINQSHVMKCTPTIVKKGYTTLIKAYGTRMKGFHVLNAPPYVQYTFNMIKSIVGPKLAARVHFYQPGDLEKFYKFVPKSILPKDYGGDEMTMNELHVGLREKIEKLRDWFIKHEKIEVNEHSHLTPAIYEDGVFGPSGSFRRIEVD